MTYGLARPSREAAIAAAFLIFSFANCIAAQKRPPAKPVELNSATATQLRELPGVGPSTAEAIVKFREKSGPFQRVEDLLAIHGISQIKLEKLRPYVFVKSKPT
jgi:competence protein ComEA